MSTPWMKWYPSDWRADPKLRMCSLAARGLWADMLALMHEAEPYGHLLVGDRAPSDKQIAALVGASPKEVSGAVMELEEAGVFSRTEEGVIYSRRMVRDKEKAERDRENGKGGGNPKLRKKDKVGVNPPDKAQKLEARDQKPEGLPLTPSGPNAEERAVELWNLLADRHDLAKVQRLTDKRLRALKARLAECGGIEGWKAALARVAESPFLLGMEKDWRADFDFLLQQSSFTKLMEGGYARKGKPAAAEDRGAGKLGSELTDEERLAQDNYIRGLSGKPPKDDLGRILWDEPPVTEMPAHMRAFAAGAGDQSHLDIPAALDRRTEGGR